MPAHARVVLDEDWPARISGEKGGEDRRVKQCYIAGQIRPTA